MSTRANATFEVTNWEEKPIDESDGVKLTRASITNSFRGEIEGTSVLEYLMVHRPDGTASFVGVERVTGRLGERTGSFVLEHRGTYDGGGAKADSRVVPGSGTGELAGLQGEGSFAAKGREAPFVLDYEIGG